MAYNPIQSKVDELLIELKKQQEIKEQQKPDDNEPQPYSKDTIKKFLLEEIKTLREKGTPEHIISEIKKNLMIEIERVFAMTKGELRIYMTQKDKEKVEEIRKHNERLVFEECLRMEVSQKGLIGIRAQYFMQDRKKAYESGKFKYNSNLLISVRILLENKDKQMPDNLKRLKDESNIIPTEVKLQEIEDRGNQLVNNNPSMVLKPKK